MSPPARYVVPAVPLLESERRLRGRLLDPSLSHAVWRAPDLEPLLFLFVIFDAPPPVEFRPAPLIVGHPAAAAVVSGHVILYLCIRITFNQGERKSLAVNEML